MGFGHIFGTKVKLIKRRNLTTSKTILALLGWDQYRKIGLKFIVCIVSTM